MNPHLRNPYIVGQWVQGENHYGRGRLLEYLLYEQDGSTWVIGTRRIGKTSLLRQLEWLTDSDPDSQFVPLYWDMQGSESIQDLAFELFFSVEDHVQRFAPYQIDIQSLEGLEPLYLLRTLLRGLERHGRRLLLLIDEAEALIDIARKEPAKVAALRKVMQDQRMRTIMTSTQLLTQLNEVSKEWVTSAFLLGFNMANLWSLDPEAARSLIGQQQSGFPIQIGDKVLEDILVHTNRHPYLVQHLCHALFRNGVDGPYLAEVTDDLLTPNQLLTGFFEVDFLHLTSAERQILLLVANQTVIEQTALLARLPQYEPGQIQNFLYAMTKLGYLRQIYGRWTIGNEFLRRWILQNEAQLQTQLKSDLNDQILSHLINVGRDKELIFLNQEIGVREEQLASLETRQRGGQNGLPALGNEIAQLRAQIKELHLEKQLAST